MAAHQFSGLEGGAMTRRQFRRRTSTSVAAAAAAVAAVLAAAPAQAAPRAGAADQRVDVYAGELSDGQFGALRDAGVDRAEVAVTRGARGRGPARR